MLFVFIFEGCGENTERPIVKEIEDINISPSSPEILSTNEKFVLRANVLYDDGTSAEITEAVRWETAWEYASLSYGELVPKVNGDVNGNPLTFDVSASYKSLEAVTSVTIVPLSGLTIDDSNITGANPQSGVEYSFKASGEYGGGERNASIGPGNSNHIFWSVTGSATLKASENGIAKVVFTSGEANVTVSGFDITDVRSYTIQ